MGQKARANREALGDKYIGKHGHKLAAKTRARGIHNKARKAKRDAKKFENIAS